MTNQVASYILKHRRAGLELESCKLKTSKEKMKQWTQKARQRAIEAKVNDESSEVISGINGMNKIQYARTVIVRKESRAVHLARGFLRGTPYKRIEDSAKKPVDSKRVNEILGSLSVEVSQDQIKEWINV